MIKTLIDKLLGRPATVSDSAQPGVVAGRRVEIPKSEHGIDLSKVDERAVKVVTTLTDAGHEAYIVGGAVRDLLLGLRPKDFDVATDATPEQVKALFRRAFIIGRRFRIVHVVYGRGREHEVIEVSTFRAYLDPNAAEQVAGNEKTSKSELAGKSHVVDAAGRVLRDNVWGPQVEDAARRDFTVNAMYYDPQREIVVDYHGGLQDARRRLLRMIGDPAARYREDPVRIVRAVRFAAKLGFELEPKTRAPVKAMAALLDNVPQSRLFDEMIKLLQTGHSLASIVELRKQGLHRGVFPILDAVLDEVDAAGEARSRRQIFIELALADTDRRVAEGKPVAPSFMLACMLWHDVLDRWQQLQRGGEPSFAALQQAVDAVFDARIGDISGRGKLAADMREIWLMQPRFDKRTGNGPHTLVEQPRFRAGFDFLRLRGEVGDVDPAIARWWEAFLLADAETRQDLLAEVRTTERPPRRVPAARPAPGAGAASTQSDGLPEDGAEGDGLSGAAPAKRRRRRRKPAGAASAEGGGEAPGMAPDDPTAG